MQSVDIGFLDRLREIFFNQLIPNGVDIFSSLTWNIRWNRI